MACDSSPCANDIDVNCTSMGAFDFTHQCAVGYTGLNCEVNMTTVCLQPAQTTACVWMESMCAYICLDSKKSMVVVCQQEVSVNIGPSTCTG